MNNNKYPTAIPLMKSFLLLVIAFFISLSCEDQTSFIRWNLDEVECNCGCDFEDERDGEIYRTVSIGTDCRMLDNLRTIPGCIDCSWCCDNNDQNCKSLGRLYNATGYSAGGGICPEGWEIPTDEDWKDLEIALGMSFDDVNLFGYRGNIANEFK